MEKEKTKNIQEKEEEARRWPCSNSRVSLPRSSPRREREILSTADGGARARSLSLSRSRGKYLPRRNE